MRCEIQSVSSRIELVSPCPFPARITITPRVQFSIISQTLIGEDLPLCRGAVGIFYNSWWLDCVGRFYCWTLLWPWCWIALCYLLWKIAMITLTPTLYQWPISFLLQWAAQCFIVMNKLRDIFYSEEWILKNCFKHNSLLLSYLRCLHFFTYNLTTLGIGPWNTGGKICSHHFHTCGLINALEKKWIEF